MGPRTLSTFQKDTRRQCCQENLKLLTEDPEHFFSVWWQETRLGYITEILSPKWSPCSGSTRLPPPLKSLGLKNLLAVMATVFWDEKGLMLLEFMPQKITITGQTYANTITALWGATIKEKRRGKLSAGVLLLHDNVPVHVCKISSCHSAMWVPTAKSPT